MAQYGIKLPMVIAKREVTSQEEHKFLPYTLINNLNQHKMDAICYLKGI